MKMLYLTGMVEYSIYHLWQYRLSLLSVCFRTITGAVIIYFRSDYQLSRTSVNDKREKLKKVSVTLFSAVEKALIY